jgi:hypothetical protein
MDNGYSEYMFGWLDDIQHFFSFLKVGLDPLGYFHLFNFSYKDWIPKKETTF